MCNSLRVTKQQMRDFVAGKRIDGVGCGEPSSVDASQLGWYKWIEEIGTTAERGVRKRAAARLAEAKLDMGRIVIKKMNTDEYELWWI